MVTRIITKDIDGIDVSLFITLKNILNWTARVKSASKQYNYIYIIMFAKININSILNKI